MTLDEKTCISYARQCTREDGFKPIWTSRKLEHIRDAAKELFVKG